MGSSHSSKISEQSSVRINYRVDSVKYDGVCLWNPFFDFAKRVKPQMKCIWPFLKLHLKKNKQAHTPKVKVDLYETPEHLVHWRVDFNNPFKK